MYPKLILCCLLVSLQAFGSITCPPDITVYCDTDLDDLSVVGEPILGGSHAYIGGSYTDQEFINSCQTGYVLRTWFVDLNSNSTKDIDEPSCQQRIDIANQNFPIQFNVPQDITIDCLDNIPQTTVTWTSGPCHWLGYSSEDMDFVAEPGVCIKIMRRHTVVDFCEYHPDDPNWNGQGLYQFDQFIKIIDQQKPEIKECETKTFGLDTDCKTNVTLTNSAIDIGDCPSSNLSWEVEIDLWGNGDIDYVFSYLKTDKFNIPIKANNEEVSIEIPEELKEGTHKVKWKVRDGCGNWQSCHTTFITTDNKAPTPYCHQFSTAAFDGDDNMVIHLRADSFDAGSFDNCSPQDQLKFSFSSDVKDDTLTIGCSKQGFNFLNIYVTDAKGNADFCRAFLIVVDNNICGFRYSPSGLVRGVQGNPIPYARFDLSRSDENIGSYLTQADGTLEMQDIPLYDDMRIVPKNPEIIDVSNLNILDYVLLKDHLLGIRQLTNIGEIAADLNGDKKINPIDLRIYKDILLEHIPPIRNWKYVYTEDLERLKLKSIKPELSIMDYKGHLDFLGIQTGDLSNQYLDSIFIRNNFKIDLRIGENTGNGYPVYLYEDTEISLKGLKISSSHSNIHFTGAMTPGIKSESSETYLWSDNLTLEPRVPLFYIESNDEIIGEGVDSEYNTIQFKIKEKATKLNIYPNPTTDILYIDKMVHPSEIELIGIDGKRHEFKLTTPRSIHIDHLLPGKYWLRVGNDYSSFIKL